jgi:hypothetical protein
MLRLPVALLVLALATSAGAEERMFGLTRNGEPIVCADVNQMAALPTDTAGSWILGFWSGLNAANHALVGDSTTPTGVIGEVKLYCASHPSVGLAQATFDTYAAMRKQKR